MQTLLETFRIMRPHQWIKNLFILLGILFGHGWYVWHQLYTVCLVMLCFAALSSSIYIFNDYIDREVDRLHPLKQLRPLAAETLSVPYALCVALILLLMSLTLALHISFKLEIILITYLILNIFYSLWLKHIVILDVLAIAAGFMLRILAGTSGIGIPPSPWLLSCALAFTLFLGFSKRYAEIKIKDGALAKSRMVLHSYSLPWLEKLIMATAILTIIIYALYTIAPNTVEMQHTGQLFFTVPFVIAGMLRYWHLLRGRNDYKYTDITYIPLHDNYLILIILGWLTLVILLLR